MQQANKKASTEVPKESGNTNPAIIDQHRQNKEGVKSANNFEEKLKGRQFDAGALKTFIANLMGLIQQYSKTETFKNKESKTMFLKIYTTSVQYFSSIQKYFKFGNKKLFIVTQKDLTQLERKFNDKLKAANSRYFELKDYTDQMVEYHDILLKRLSQDSARPGASFEKQNIALQKMPETKAKIQKFLGYQAVKPINSKQFQQQKNSVFSQLIKKMSQSYTKFLDDNLRKFNIEATPTSEQILLVLQTNVQKMAKEKIVEIFRGSAAEKKAKIGLVEQAAEKAEAKLNEPNFLCQKLGARWEKRFNYCQKIPYVQLQRNLLSQKTRCSQLQKKFSSQKQQRISQMKRCFSLENQLIIVKRRFKQYSKFLIQLFGEIVNMEQRLQQLQSENALLKEQNQQLQQQIISRKQKRVQ